MPDDTLTHPAPTTHAASGPAPGTLIDLRRWYLTLPVGSPKKTISAGDFRSRTKCYFKAGAYNKTEIEEGDEGASVVRHFLLELKQG